MQKHVLAIEQLPAHHKDPFDRVLVAQARVDKLSLLTADEILKRYDVAVVWAGAGQPDSKDAPHSDSGPTGEMELKDEPPSDSDPKDEMGGPDHGDGDPGQGATPADHRGRLHPPVPDEPSE